MAGAVRCASKIFFGLAGKGRRTLDGFCWESAAREDADIASLLFGGDVAKVREPCDGPAYHAL